MKKLLAASLCAIGLALPTGKAHAIMIGLSPSATSVTVGDSVDLGLTISGLGDGTAPSLGAFDLDITFDATILGFTSVTFGPFLGDPALGEAITGVDSSVPGTVNLFELSLLEADGTTCIFCIPPFLDDIQPASFTLATLSFDGLAVGSSLVEVTNVLLSDAFGLPLVATIQDGPEITVSNAVAVPEPGSFALLCVGLAAISLLGMGHSTGQGASSRPQGPLTPVPARARRGPCCRAAGPGR